MGGERKRELPVRKCPACGGEFFRDVTLHQWLKPEAQGLVRCDPSGRLDSMAPALLLCLCGTPQKWQIGGGRGGRTPNVEIGQFLESMKAGIQAAKERHDPVGGRINRISPGPPVCLSIPL